ncbi:major royal jelly protein 4 precursor, putative [Pediculus humanus corporis]|nr:major royal jelly protein 4 precursor, putative [Pediculus humanus corporis]EEB18858.1 major royal jelly protein 4 precursor, putative [Pediculus humanus corporis]
MKVIHGWKTVDFVFPSTAIRHSMLRSGQFIPGNSLILDADYWQEDVIFVTLPRLRNGIPATLATVSSFIDYDESPKLLPFPDWTWHDEDNCEGLVSVFRIKVDECGRLWIVDSGVTDALNTAKKICPPKIMVFDLHTNTLELKYVIPDNLLSSLSLLVTIAVDNRRFCDDAFAYIADVGDFGVIVFDSRRHRSWKVKSNYFYPYPNYGSFNIAGTEFDLMDGVIGLALGPLNKYGLASVAESKVSTSFLRNESNFLSGDKKISKRFYTSDNVRPSQSAAQDMSQNKILFFGLLSKNSIACWNSRMPYLPFNIITLAQNNETLQFSSGIKVIKKNGLEELLVTTSRFQKYLLNEIDNNDVNYRILSASVNDLVKNTLCEFGSSFFPESYQTIEITNWN